MTFAAVLAHQFAQMRQHHRSAAGPTASSVIGLIREDFWTHGSEWTRPGFHAIAAHRVGAWLPHAPRLVRLVLGPIYRMMYVWVRNVYGIELPASTVVGRRLRFSHQSGIVIHPNARIGDDCVIRQNVTIGAPALRRGDDVAVLGDRVEIGAGAAIIGRVRVGDDVHIGPNAVVMTSVPASSTVVAARSLRLQLARRPRPSARELEAPAGHDTAPHTDPAPARDAG